MAPFKSEAQRKLFYAKAERGEIPESTVREYEHETHGNLPEHVKAKKKTQKYTENKGS